MEYNINFAKYTKLNYISSLHEKILMAQSTYASNSFPGLAGSTGTRVDSASKHIMACKVHSAMLSGWCENAQNSNNHMHMHKHKYCMTRDELVLNVGMPLNSISNMIKPGQAYPAVVTTLGDMSPQAQQALLVLYHASKTGGDFMNTKNLLHKMASGKEETFYSLFSNADSQSCDWRKISMELKNMPYFIAQGYSLGIAYASSLSGDTVGSVLIGGMCTVMNGAFECKAGQMLHWYFDFERNCFFQDNEHSRHGMIMAGTRRNIDIGKDLCFFHQRLASRFPRLLHTLILINIDIFISFSQHSHSLFLRLWVPKLSPNILIILVPLANRRAKLGMKPLVKPKDIIFSKLIRIKDLISTILLQISSHLLLLQVINKLIIKRIIAMSRQNTLGVLPAISSLRFESTACYVP